MPQRVAAGGDEIAAAGGIEPLVELRRRQQLAIDRAAHRGDAADLVHRRTHHREIEPILAADIAVEDLSDMQPDISRRGGTAVRLPPLVQRCDVLAEQMLGAERSTSRMRHVLAGEHREHTVTDQLQHVAAGIVDRIDHGLRIVVEKRDDLVGTDALADPGRAAQIRVPQHCLDALGDAARDAAAQHLLGGAAAEIDAPERARDIDLLRRLDREPQHRHEIAQGLQLGFAEAAVAARGPAGIEAIHQAERAVLAEAVHDSEIMLMALLGEFADLREIQRRRVGEIDHHLVVAVLEHVEEHRAAPVLGRIAFGGRTVFERVALVARPVAPAETAALIDRMQRVDDDEGAREFQALGAAASQNPRSSSLSGRPVSPWPVSQFISARREVNCMRHYAVHS
uniref:Adenylate cyclases-like protein n=1 Tax=Bradyrhizobium japonicum TaxID=375 RepID=Q9RH57_BRAJP|nr:adenylate cyclases-like protein [Bradyrhizobium japonicum]